MSILKMESILLVKIFRISLLSITSLFLIFLIGVKFEIFQNGYIYIFLYLLFPLLFIEYFLSFLFLIFKKELKLVKNITLLFGVAIATVICVNLILRTI